MTALPRLFRPQGQELKLPAQPLRVIGIDLGATNSTVAELVWRPGAGGLAPVRCLEVAQETQEGSYTFKRPTWS